MIRIRTKTLFLPGAGGSASFWRPVAARTALDSVFLAWPGLGDEPPVPEVTAFNDLVTLVIRHMDEPVNIVAQSMGGLVAIKAALAAPDKLRRLVLAVTSAGVPVGDLGGVDWRSDYYQAYPHAARWIGDTREDLSARLALVTAPTLLLWGDHDPISPLAVGRRLCALLPDARLHVIPGGDHDLAQTHVREVAGLIEQHLMAPAAPPA